MRLSIFNLENLLENALNKADLDARSSSIIKKRFGLDSSETVTLQKLGAEYNVTRERIRQLETRAISQIRRGIETLKETCDVREFAENHLVRSGGVRKDNDFMEEFYIISGSNGDKNIFGNKAKFIFKILEYPHFSEENDVFHGFWYASDEVKSKMEAIHDEIIRKIKRVEHFEEIMLSAIKPHNINEHVAANFLSVSKKIGIGPYGDIGMSHWEEINPKTVKAKAFLLLKKSGAPMHFTEIARRIDSHTPTVHNELIKDPHFILVGRGTYALKLK